MKNNNKTEIFSELILKKSALGLIAGKISNIEAFGEDEELAKDEILVTLAYWIGNIQAYLEGKLQEVSPSLTLDSLVTGADAAITTFKAK